MRMMRCLAPIDIAVTGVPVTERLWPGLEVDFDRELKPGFKLGDAIAGKEACFEPVVVKPEPVASPVKPRE